ncbi:SH3 domain-containing protein [Pseudodesulfovibrio sp. zrk46]|uniref:SH3 domain-containing protein n=1 Tax=Pseudodesulfovibrio sp. zrk46 TaxID=2725288 RepID=UPI00144A1BC6|nr:SH3 domain-containing protein [Pseudodesulfovibrio sp. zrk46]QJB56040.1 SH3 domain-containing protein [Pseudodesulfovibrio sp. zrk46]
MKIALLPLIACTLMVLAMPSLSYSEADGPDHWQILGVESNDVLNIRAEPDWQSEKIGEIPPDGQCVRNLGCKGGLTFQEFTTLSDEEKEAIKKNRPRWCKVEYQGVTGWVAGKYLREGFCGK